MALAVVQIVVTALTPVNNPVTIEVSLSQPFLRNVKIAIPAAKLGAVGVRISSQNQTLAPVVGVGLYSWIVPLSGDGGSFNQYTRLEGPPYKVQIEAWNSDAADQTIYIHFETDHFNYAPVNLMNTAKPGQSQEQPKGDPSKSENDG
jgi:hypothetical protein